MYRPAGFKRTFYNNLRVYDKSPSPSKIPHSSLLSSDPNLRSRTSLKMKDDVFLRSQVHFSDKFAKETKYVRQYQRHMDYRLSIPKKIVQSPRNKVRNVRCSQIDPVGELLEREKSGERLDLSNYKKYSI